MCYTHTKFKTSIKSWIIFEKVHRVIKFNKNAWVNPYIDANTDVRKIAKNYFEKKILKLIDNAVARKSMENVGKNRDIKLATTERRINYLVSELNYHSFLQNIC